MSPSETKPKPFRTANLTLAAYLAHLDWGYALVRGEGKSAVWDFDPGAKVHADKFQASKAMVEPQAFHHSVARHRKLLFSFLAPGCTDKEWTQEQVAEKLG